MACSTFIDLLLGSYRMCCLENAMTSLYGEHNSSFHRRKLGGTSVCQCVWEGL